MMIFLRFMSNEKDEGEPLCLRSEREKFGVIIVI